VRIPIRPPDPPKKRSWLDYARSWGNAAGTRHLLVGQIPACASKNSLTSDRVEDEIRTDAAAMYRRKYPEEAAAQDQRVKAQAQLAEQAKAEGRPEPKPVVSNRINELRAQAESEIGPKVKNRDVAVDRRHLQLVMEEHNASLPSGDTRVRAQVDPQTGRTVYDGTHFDPSDPVHQWLLFRMDPVERKFIAMAQASRRKATIEPGRSAGRCFSESGGKVEELISARPVSDFVLQRTRYMCYITVRTN
jgi:hypothetical protein